MKSPTPPLFPPKLTSRAGGLLLLATGVLSNILPAEATVATSVPQPVTTHPRLWITPTDIPKLQSWATPTNPIYQKGLLPTLNQAQADYDACFPGGVQAKPYPDAGDVQGYTGIVSEQAAWVLAFQSLIDPVPANRIKYAQEARNLIMVVMNQAVLGPKADAPFRDPAFAIYNRASENAEAFPLVVDWIYNTKDASNKSILTTQDKATIRTVFLIWAQQCLNASTTGGDHPDPVGAMNSTALLPGKNAYRMAANNYYTAHVQLLTLMSLSLDPTDDPPLQPNRSAATLGNTLRSYILDVTGAWLYQQYAMYGEPSAIRTAYGLPPTATVGLANGGMPAEGLLYGDSYTNILGEMLALKTAGFATTALSGPQAALADGNAPIWDRFNKAMISSLVPAAQTPEPLSSFTNPLIQLADPDGETYLGPIYQFASYGDILRMYMTPNFVCPFAILSMLDEKSGVTTRTSAERWFIVNAVEGGKSALYTRTADPYSWGVQDTILTFLALDPVDASTGYNYPDPRPGYAKAFFDAPQGHLVEHSDWTPSGSMFDTRCSWNSINHQQCDAGQFELYRKGEWLTKGLANYDNNYIGQSSEFHNTLSLQNWCANNVSAAHPNGIPSDLLGSFNQNLWLTGSQFSLNEATGDPTTIVSITPAYTYQYSDLTKLYNIDQAYSSTDWGVDITHASRSVIWLKPDYVVAYDRGTSIHNGFKRVDFTVVGTPVVSGNQIYTTTPGGEHLMINSLLPGTATTTITTSTVASANITTIASKETADHRVTIEDTAKSTNVRFLHVLEGIDKNGVAGVTSRIVSTSGTPFDGAVITGLKTVVMFKRDMTTPFVSVTFTLPSGITSYYVTGLTPSAGYTVTRSGLVITVTAGGAIAADQAGVLTGPPSTATVLATITSQPVSTTVVVGTTASFNVQAVATAPLTYRWERVAKGTSTWAILTNTATYVGVNTPNLQVKNTTIAMHGDRFHCVVTGANHTAVSATASMLVQAAPPAAPAIKTQPVPQVVLIGKNVVYSVVATGGGTLNYQWEVLETGATTWKPLLYEGAYWNGGSSQTITLSNVTKAMYGWQFRCVVSNGTKPDVTSVAVKLVEISAL